MMKTKSKNMVFMLLIALLIFNTTSFAAIYDWIGAVDSNWDVPSNWAVTGSSYTWPNQQYMMTDNRWVNDDCEEINIISGDIVSRIYNLAMSGASAGSNKTVMTIKDNSGLHILGHLWIGQNSNGTVEVEVSNGSSLTVDKILIVGDADESTGLLEVINGAVEVKENMFVGKAHNSTGVMQIKRNAPSAGYDLTAWKNLTVGNSHDSVGTVEIKDSSVQIKSDLIVAKSGNSSGILEVKSSFMAVDNGVNIGLFDGASGSMEIKNGTLVIGVTVTVGYSGNALGTMEIKDSTVEIGKHLIVGTLENSTGIVEIKNSSINIGKHLLVPDKESSSGTMNIKDNSIITVGGKFAMNHKNGTGSVSEVVVDGGNVAVTNNSLINSSGGAGSIANFTLNDGIWDSGGDIKVGETLEGDSYLTINSGMMVSGDTIFIGNPSGSDDGESKIFLNGGVLQGENLMFNPEIGDSLIIYRGGELWINNSNVTETDMQDFIDNGKIDVPSGYEVTTIGSYTVLRS